ncbi:tetratricopeptide repeat protein [bacterium]|nr:tetratricopeptide repeat protein [bacterium]
MDNEIEELQAILKEDPYNFQARRTLSLALLDNGFNKEAKKTLLYLVRTFPDNAELHYNLGIACEKTREFEHAERAYLRAIELSPETDFYYNLGLTYIEMKEYGKAIVALKNVIEREPEDENTLFNIGLCFYQNNEYEVAIDYFKKAIELNKDDVFAHFYLANILKHFGQYDLAINEYQIVISIVPDYSWAYFNLGQIAFEMGETEVALQYLHKTISYNPKDIEAIKIIVQIYLKQQRYQEALDVLQIGMEANAENGDLFYLTSRVFKETGNIENYILALERAIINQETLTFDFERLKNIYKNLKLVYPQE